MTTEDTVRLALSVEDARKRLGLSRGLMYEAVRTGQIPSVRIGRRILIPLAALERLLEDAGTHRDRSTGLANVQPGKEMSV